LALKENLRECEQEVGERDLLNSISNLICQKYPNSGSFDRAMLISAFAAATCLLEQTDLFDKRLTNFSTNNTMEIVTERNKKIQLVSPLAKDIYIDPSLSEITSNVSRIKAGVEREIQGLKSQKRGGRKTAWSLIEDKYVENVTEQEAFKQALTINPQWEELDEYRRRGVLIKTRFRLASQRAEEDMFNKKYSEAVKEYQSFVLRKDLEFIEWELRTSLTELSNESLTFLIRNFIEIRNKWLKSGGQKSPDDELRWRILQPLLKKVRFNKEEDEIPLENNSENLKRAISIIKRYTRTQNSEYTLINEKALKEYIYRCLSENKPIVFSAALCPTRWPKRLLYRTPKERAQFYDPNPWKADAVDLLPITQDLAFQLQSQGFKVKFEWAIFVSDEEDYIRFTSLNPWLQDRETKNLLRENVELFKENISALLMASLGDSFGGCKINILGSGQTKDEIEKIDNLCQSIKEEAKSNKSLRNLICEIAERRKSSFEDPNGFYNSAYSEVGGGLTSRDYGNIALRYIATYRRQFLKYLNGIRVDNSYATMARAFLLKKDGANFPVVNPFPRPDQRNRIRFDQIK